MSTHDALRQAVLASPDDDLPRLVFADFLEESGDPERAEFIRAQIELANTPEYEPFAVVCETRKREWVTGEALFRKELGEITDPPVATWAEPYFRRGFEWNVRLSGPNQVALLSALFQTHAIERVQIGTGTLDQWREFAASPWLPRIRSLAFTGLSSPNEPLRCLRESPLTTGITSLRLEHTNLPSIPIILGELFATPLGRQLTSLSMRLGYGHTDETLEAIAENQNVRLNDLDLYRMGFGPAAARVFVDSGLAKQTEVLRLVGNPLMRPGVAILATAANSLRVLDLSETMLDTKGVEPLAQSNTFISLRKLVLTGNKLGSDGIKLISRSPQLAGLRSLGLENTGCDNAGVRYVTRGAFWPNLVELDLRRNLISDVGVKHLLTARSAPDMTNLVLPKRNLTDVMRDELVAKFGEVVKWSD